MGVPFAPAFLAGEPRTAPFLSSGFRDADARRRHVAQARARRLHPALHQALVRDDGALPPSPARVANVAALAEAGTVAVVTGQQVGLFLGPLYCLFKAAAAVACARALQAETGTRCVPVFWLQTEDHDFDELNHTFVLDERGGEVVRLALVEAPPPRTQVHRAVLGASVEQALSRLAACVEGRPHADEVLALLRAHYQPGRTVTQAFAGVLAALFADEGLVLVDPRAPGLAAAAAPVHRRAFEDTAALAQGLEARVAALEAAGFDAQVTVRPGAPLSFFHPDGADGPRFRLVPQGDGFALVGREGVVSRAALDAALAAEPERFSTSALLRPILQDTLLPTAAVIGGPGELNYFAQVGPLYDTFGLPPPLMVPRARFRLLEPRVRAQLDELGLAAAQLEAPLERVLAAARRDAAPALDAAELERRLVDAAAAVLAQVPEPRGQDVADALARTQATVARAASRLAGRYRRAQETTDGVRLERARRAQRALFPDGQPQERVFGFAAYAARVGPRALVERVLAAVDPWHPDVKELSL